MRKKDLVGPLHIIKTIRVDLTICLSKTFRTGIAFVVKVITQ